MTRLGAVMSQANGGKDGHPFPVPLRVYDETIRVLKSAVQKARLGREEELAAINRLDEQARLLERRVSGPSIEKLIAEEQGRSQAYDGRTAFGMSATRSTPTRRWDKAARDHINVRYWHKADMLNTLTNVRYWG
jgi:uncharacterized protein